MPLVLLVDDDEMLLGVLKMMLTSEKYEVLTAGDGNKAIGIVNAVDLDLVISDIRMSPMNGIELLRLIHAAKPNLPVVMLTAYASAKTAKECKQLGAVGYLSKPFTNDEVLGVVQHAIETSKSKAAAAPTGSPGTPAP
jgi:DNA-binding NtrC family response regulator